MVVINIAAFSKSVNRPDCCRGNLQLYRDDERGNGIAVGGLGGM